MAYLELTNLGKSFGKERVRAVDSISLAVEQGEFVVLVGSSGCGKSTTLRLVAGLEQPDSGTIMLDGRDVTRAQPAERNVAMVFQDYALYPHLTVFDNIAFPLKVKKLGRDAIEAKVAEVASLLEIDGILDRKPPKLSGGQQQRVAIGRALVREPSVFLMDEPLSNLDAKLRTQMRVELANLHRMTGATILYVTHDQTEAMTLATKIVVMDQGRIQQIGAPRDLYRKPRNLFVATFIGSPPMNIIPCRLHRGTVQCANTSFDASMFAAAPPEAEGRSLLLGIRPEHVSIEEGEHACSTRLLPVIEGAYRFEESVGSDAYVTFAVGSATVVVKAGFEAHSRFASGDRALLRLDVRHALLFDARTGAHLG